MILLDYSDKRPIYEQVTEKMKMLIMNGALEPGSKLPSVRSLAIDLSVNPNTIQRSYAELERCGFIYSVKGRGNFVSEDTRGITAQKEQTIKELEQKIGLCKKQGITKEEILYCLNTVYGEVPK